MRHAALYLLAAAAAAIAYKHDYIAGHVTFGDKIAYKHTFAKVAIPFLIREEIVEIRVRSKITAVHVADNSNVQSSGSGFVVRGGVGAREAQVLLKSDKGWGYNFTITVYVQLY